MNIESILFAILSSIIATIFVLLTYLSIHDFVLRKKTRLLQRKLETLNSLSKRKQAQLLREKKELLEKILKGYTYKEVQTNEKNTRPSISASTGDYANSVSGD
jgi:hypothetical protein